MQHLRSYKIPGLDICDITLSFNFSSKTNGDVKFRSSHRMGSVKKVFLEISQNSLENTCPRDYFLILFNIFLQSTSERMFCTKAGLILENKGMRVV